MAEKERKKEVRKIQVKTTITHQCGYKGLTLSKLLMRMGINENFYTVVI